MENNYYNNDALNYSALVDGINVSMSQVNASFVKEDNFNEKLRFNIGENDESSRVYTIDSFCNDSNTGIVNSLVLNYKGESNIYAYAEILKTGFNLLMNSANFNDDEIQLFITCKNGGFKKDFEKLKNLLLDFDLDFDEVDDTEVKDTTDFCFVFYAGKEEKALITGGNYNGGVFLYLNIDDTLISLYGDFMLNENKVDACVIAVSEEEKRHALKIVDKLRSVNLRTYMFTNKMTKSDQKKAADNLECEFIINIDDENLKKGLVTITENYTNEDNVVDLDSVEEFFTEIIF